MCLDLYTYITDRVTSSVGEIKKLDKGCAAAYFELQQMFNDRVAKGEASKFDAVVQGEVDRVFAGAEVGRSSSDRARDVILCRMIAKLLHRMASSGSDGILGGTDAATLFKDDMGALEVLHIETASYYTSALSVIDEAKKWCRNEKTDYFKVSVAFSIT